MPTQARPRHFGLALTLIISGTCLILMPQIHESVVQANVLFALGIAQDHSAPAAARIEGIARSRTTWIGSASVVIGAAMVLLGALFGSTSLRSHQT